MISEHSTNGAAAVLGPQMVRMELWVDVGAEETYPGFRFKMWRNFPTALGLQVRAGTEDEAQTALRAIVLEHNGWRDTEGRPFPQPAEPGFWEAIPMDLAMQMLIVVATESRRLPNSARPTRAD